VPGATPGRAGDVSDDRQPRQFIQHPGSVLDLGMTTRRVELASEHPGRRQRMTGEGSVEPSDSKGRGFQWGDHITVAQPVRYSRRGQRMRLGCSRMPRASEAPRSRFVRTRNRKNEGVRAAGMSRSGPDQQARSGSRRA
jgi:hypothetical protein